MVLRAELPAARTAHTEDTLTGLNDAVTPSGLIFKHDSIYGLISKHVSPSSSPARASKTILPHHWPLYLQDEVSQIGSSLLNGGSGNQVHSQTASTTECRIQVPRRAFQTARVSMARKLTGVLPLVHGIAAFRGLAQVPKTRYHTRIVFCAGSIPTPSGGCSQQGFTSCVNFVTGV